MGLFSMSFTIYKTLPQISYISTNQIYIIILLLKNHSDCLQRFYILTMTHQIIIRTHFIAVIFGVHLNFVIRIIIIFHFNVVNQLNCLTTISLFNLDAKNKGFSKTCIFFKLFSII